MKAPIAAARRSLHRIRLHSIAAAVALTLGLCAQAGADTKKVNFSPPAELFSAPAAPAVMDLTETADSAEQKALEACLHHQQLEAAVASKHLSVSLVDITNTAHPVLAQVNGDHMFYAASLPKIAILLGAFEKAHEGQLEMDDATITELQQMIRRSSNHAASDMLARVGIPYLAKVLESDKYRLYDPKRNGGLWVGKPYAGTGAEMRDPLHGLSHGATAFQVSRFYYLMETGQLVSPQASRQMKEIMGSPEINHKFVAGLHSVHPEAALFRKSGTWRNFHADSAIIERAGRRYIAVALSDDPRGGDWFKSLIVGLDDIVFAAAPAGV